MKEVKEKRKPARVYQLESTNHCNASCKYCPHEDMTREKGFVSLKTVNLVIQNCLDNKQDYIALHHMGEPLLHPTIGTIIWNFYKKGIKSEISTNGLFLDRKGYDILINKVKLVRIAIDFYYHREGFMDIIEDFLKLAQRFPDTEIRIHTVVGNDMSRLEHYTKDGKVTLETKVFDNWGGQVEGDSELAKGNDCYFQKFNYVVVLWNGDVVTCCLDFNGTNIIGQVDNLSNIKNKPCNLCNTCANLQFADGGGWKE